MQLTVAASTNYSGVQKVSTLYYGDASACPPLPRVGDMLFHGTANPVPVKTVTFQWQYNTPNTAITPDAMEIGIYGTNVAGAELDTEALGKYFAELRAQGK